MGMRPRNFDQPHWMTVGTIQIGRGHSAARITVEREMLGFVARDSGVPAVSFAIPPSP